MQLQVARQPQDRNALSPWVTLAATASLLLLGVALAQLKNAKKETAHK